MMIDFLFDLDFVLLNTEVENRSSNFVYQSLGFERVCKEGTWKKVYPLYHL